MHRKHLIPCAVMLAAVALTAGAWGVQFSTFALFGVMLLCPAAMLLMMRGMAASAHRDASSDADSRGRREIAP